jgi:hypothetical protein
VCLLIPIAIGCVLISCSSGPTSPSTAGPTPIPSNLWSPPSGATPDTGNFVYLASDAGDFVGEGETILDTPPQVGISAQYSTVHLIFTVHDTATNMPIVTGIFYAMNAISHFERGYYFVPSGPVLGNGSRSGLEWTTQGHGCDSISGWFTVDQVTYTGDTLTSIDLRFEQHCDGAGPALHGAVHWRG